MKISYTKITLKTLKLTTITTTLLLIHAIYADESYINVNLHIYDNRLLPGKPKYLCAFFAQPPDAHKCDKLDLDYTTTRGATLVHNNLNIEYNAILKKYLRTYEVHFCNLQSLGCATASLTIECVDPDYSYHYEWCPAQNVRATVTSPTTSGSADAPQLQLRTQVDKGTVVLTVHDK